MESFELILKAIASIPDLAIWAMVIFYGYQVLIAGSIYATIRFVTKTVVDGLVAMRKEPKRVQLHFRGLLFSPEVSEKEILELLKEVKGSLTYVHPTCIQELTQAWRKHKGIK